LRDHLEYKGQNNEDKGYLKSTRTQRKNHSQRKKNLHPKSLGSKSPSSLPHKKNEKKRRKKTKPNQTKPKKYVTIGMVCIVEGVFVEANKMLASMFKNRICMQPVR